LTRAEDFFKRWTATASSGEDALAKIYADEGQTDLNRLRRQEMHGWRWPTTPDQTILTR
jgi:hypothetical protein